MCYYEVFLLKGTTKQKEEVSDKDVAVIARDHLTSWEPLRPFLDLTRPQEETIRRTYPDYGKQKEECLQLWRQTKGKKATYGALITAAEQARDQNLADSVRSMIGADGPS